MHADHGRPPLDTSYQRPPAWDVALPHRRSDRNAGAQAVFTMLLTMAVVAGPWLLPSLLS